MSEESKKKTSVVSRPEKRSFDQKVPRGVSTLLGEADEGREPFEDTGHQEDTASSPRKRGNRGRVREEPRVTFSLRYKTSYKDRLEQLYLQERIKGRKVQKVDLVEEALDLLFEKYDHE